MGAVDFGIIVDGAVVIVESIVSRLQGGHARQHDPSISERIRAAVREVVRPTVFALMIIIAAYLPIFMLERVEGRMFAPLAHTVVAALVGSLVFSVTLVPVLATFAYRGPSHHRESPVLRFASWLYRPTLRFALRRPALILGTATLSLVMAIKLLASVGSEFLPALNEGAIYVTFTLPPSTSLEESQRMMPKLSAVADAFPEVEARMTQLGRPEDGTDPKLSNNLELFLKLRPASSWPSETKDLDALIAKMSASYAVIPGLEANFSQPITDNVNENISGQQGQIALKFYGHDLDRLQEMAEAAKAALRRVPGAADVGLVKSGTVPQLAVRPRRDALGRFGLGMKGVQEHIGMALGGRTVGTLWDGERSFDVVARLPERAREDVERIRALRVPTSSGALVPLETLARIQLEQGKAAINRENGQRYVGVRMNVRGRDMGSFVADAQRAVEDAVPAVAGVTREWGGEFESKERALRRLSLVVPVALLITLALLFNAFRSLSLAVLVLLNVPFALVGGAIGLWVFDMPFSIAAAVGFIALVGQASLNGVLVLSAVEERRRAGASLLQAVEDGASERLRAVLMTAALAALGLVPAALSRAMGSETQRPIAVVIVGGTISAALLTLIVLPVMYALMRSLFARLGLAPTAPEARGGRPGPRGASPGSGHQPKTPSARSELEDHP
jgi:cobalt-zinc-cadmium resistance protein CzcA